MAAPDVPPSNLTVTAHSTTIGVSRSGWLVDTRIRSIPTSRCELDTVVMVRLLETWTVTYIKQGNGSQGRIIEATNALGEKFRPTAVDTWQRMG